MRIEFPRGSGQVADYAPFEEDEIREILLAVEEGRMPRAEGEVVCRLIHETKMLGGRLVPASEVARSEEPAFYMPPPDSPFQIPESVVRDLMLDGAEPSL